MKRMICAAVAALAVVAPFASASTRPRPKHYRVGQFCAAASETAYAAAGFTCRNGRLAKR